MSIRSPGGIFSGISTAYLHEVKAWANAHPIAAKVVGATSMCLGVGILAALPFKASRNGALKASLGVAGGLAGGLVLCTASLLARRFFSAKQEQ